MNYSIIVFVTAKVMNFEQITTNIIAAQRR